MFLISIDLQNQVTKTKYIKKKSVLCFPSSIKFISPKNKQVFLLGKDLIKEIVH